MLFVVIYYFQQPSGYSLRSICMKNDLQMYVQDELRSVKVNFKAPKGDAITPPYFLEL